MRKIDFDKRAQKFIASLPQKHQQQVVRNIVGLQSNPQPQDAKKLRGYEYYRIDSGEYRIVYDWDELFVYILVVGKRNDGAVYKKLDQK